MAGIILVSGALGFLTDMLLKTHPKAVIIGAVSGVLIGIFICYRIMSDYIDEHKVHEESEGEILNKNEPSKQMVDSDLENKKYIFLIIKIILLTNIPAIIMLIANYRSGIGWIAGSLGSAVNFYFLSRNTMGLGPFSGKSEIKSVSKNLMIRYLFLIVWSVIVILTFGLHRDQVVIYGIALFTAQFAIYLHQAYQILTQGKLKKYFQGED